LPALRTRTTDLRLMSQHDGSRQLRFGTTISNAGPGELVVAANRATSDSSWEVSQQVVAADGAVVGSFPMNVQPVWAGDGHNHWHLPDIADYRLVRSSDGAVVGANHKIGFCLFDKLVDARAQTPSRREFPDDMVCAHGDPAATKIRMGLSVGYCDIYWWATPGQSVDITGLPDGDYRLEGKADGANALHQTEPADDVDRVDFRLTGNATAAGQITEPATKSG
jgi:hypothetical protein